MAGPRTRPHGCPRRPAPLGLRPAAQDAGRPHSLHTSTSPETTPMRVLCSRRDTSNTVPISGSPAVHLHLERTAVAGDVERGLTLQQLHLAAEPAHAYPQAAVRVEPHLGLVGQHQVAKFTLSGTVKPLGGHHLRNQAHAQQGDTGCGSCHPPARTTAPRHNARRRVHATEQRHHLGRRRLPQRRRLASQRRLQRFAHLPVQREDAQVGAHMLRRALHPVQNARRPASSNGPSRLPRNQSMASQAIVSSATGDEVRFM